VNKSALFLVVFITSGHNHHDMDYMISAFQSRGDDALFAILAVIIIQSVLILISKFIGKAVMPVPLIEAIARPLAVFLCDRLNRKGRSDFALVIRGSLVFFMMGVIVFGLGILIEQFMATTQFHPYMNVVILAVTLSPLSILPIILGVSKGRAKQGQYRALAIITNQNLITSDDHGLRRVCYQSLVIAMIDYVIAPLLFYVVAGMWGAYLYVTLSIMVRVAGRNNPAFLSLYYLLYRALYFIASWVGCVFMILAAFFSAGASRSQILKSVRYPQHIILACFAFSQKITLGGAFQDRLGNGIKSPWIGADNASAKIDHRDVLRGVIHYSITLFLVLVVLLATYIYL